MEFKISLLIMTLMVLIHRCSVQVLDSRFIVRLGHFRQPLLDETIIHCAGTLISEQHILTTASCVIVELPTEIAINIEVVTIVPEGGNTSVSSLRPADGVFIHPHYIDNQDKTANAAIVMTNAFKTNPTLGFVPRLLTGALPSSSSCNLFGWGGALLDPRRDAVVVNDPEFCDPSFPQSFCSIFNSTINATCDALLGSPLTCGNDAVVAGFLTNDGGCSTNAERTMLNYHSVHHFRDWIEGVFGPELPERNAVNFIVTVMEFNPPSTLGAIPRCFGTIITSSRVLTTAICASVESPLALALQTRIVQGSTSRTTTYSASVIYIHPSYRKEEPFVNNVAIIEIGGQFEQVFVPRDLGSLESLQSNRSCQLFGWGPTNIGFTRGDSVTVYDSKFCNSSFDQAYCSAHPTIFHYSCYAMTGSPVTCGNESIIDGFLINNASCSTTDGGISLNYHSVSQFSEFISDPVNYIPDPNTAVIARISTIVILFVVFINSLT